jgi:hypothetical protein
VAFGLLALFAIMAASALAVTKEPFATGKNKKGQLIAPASGTATLTKPVYVSVKSVPAQTVKIQWSITCITGTQGTAKLASGTIAAVKAPFTNHLIAKLPGKPPCAVSAYVTEPKKGSLVVTLNQH